MRERMKEDSLWWFELVSNIVPDTAFVEHKAYTAQ